MGNAVFDQEWEKSEDEFSDEEKELKKNELKRQFETHYDKATDVILSLKRRQKEMLKEKFKNFDLNSWRENISDIEDHELAKKDIATRYEEFFGEKLNR
jgi:hypothetical protein